MNYFAHGARFRGRPWFLAGTAVPDWLAVADRSVRLRRPAVAPLADGGGTPEAEIAAGVLQHLADDAWFHGTEAFAAVTGEMAELFRRALPAGDGFRPGFLGHLVTELLLDAALIEDEPGRLDEYYAELSALDPAAVERAVNAMGCGSTDRLARFIERFLASEFLRDYARPEGLRWRLNQVLGRVGLSPLPAPAEQVLEAGRRLVRRRATWLMGAERGSGRGLAAGPRRR